MARVTVEDCAKQVDNRFALVIMGTKRAKQLISGASPLVSLSRDKPTVLSLREIATGKIKFDRDVREVLAGKFDPAKK